MQKDMVYSVIFLSHFLRAYYFSPNKIENVHMMKILFSLSIPRAEWNFVALATINCLVFCGVTFQCVTFQTASILLLF